MILLRDVDCVIDQEIVLTVDPDQFRDFQELFAKNAFVDELDQVDFGLVKEKL